MGPSPPPRSRPAAWTTWPGPYPPGERPAAGGPDLLGLSRCPEGRGFDELGQKGVLYVELEEGRAQAQLLPLGRRQYEILPVDVTGKEPLEAVLAALPQDTSEHIYRIVLTGEGESPNLPALERELAPRFYGLTLRDQTRLPTDLWKRREEDTLTGLFLRAMWTKCQEEPEERTYQMAARFGLAALEGGEDVSL